MSSAPENTYTSTSTSTFASTTNTSEASPPSYSTAAPPPYKTSDACSLASGKSTSKSFLSKMLPRKAPEATVQRTSTAQKMVDVEEAKQAARATYFSSLR
ncbi:hypothetical protein GMOD_00004869 [Pyrenophora seminiperda CCB06]|uniref:Uncharacterized protein n=1 Tax=Pyrenophora seminiperda CCB06 TaxID=1302712 RepID=A0A3M7MHR1_9PLEO|nr:hypothetical protein GMOD_00004869 [Pyrenophora seminiperda CCB06]